LRQCIALLTGNAGGANWFVSNVGWGESRTTDLLVARLAETPGSQRKCLMPSVLTGLKIADIADSSFYTFSLDKTYTAII